MGGLSTIRRRICSPEVNGDIPVAISRVVGCARGSRGGRGANASSVGKYTTWGCTCGCHGLMSWTKRDKMLSISVHINWLSIIDLLIDTYAYNCAQKLRQQLMPSVIWTRKVRHRLASHVSESCKLGTDCWLECEFHRHISLKDLWCSFCYTCRGEKSLTTHCYVLTVGLAYYLNWAYSNPKLLKTSIAGSQIV